MTPPAEASLAKVRWLCRRGMLELDAWLVRFLEAHYFDLPTDAQQVFTRLLDQDDKTLFDWLAGVTPPPAEFKDIVESIRAK